MNKHTSLSTSPSLSYVAIQAALQAGALLRRGFGTSFEISSKPGRQNLVTEYDKLAESTIISAISRFFPDHGFLAEEGGEKKGTSIVWVIDPLDGTVNFAHNVPLFSVSIAACTEKETLCGVVYQPMTNELFVAEKDNGAFLNGSPLRVSTTDNLENALCATGFPYNVHENPMHCIDRLATLLHEGAAIRRLGSAALDLSYVAAGRFDTYWEVTLQPWDMAAGKLIVEEAGGKVTHYDGSPRGIYEAGPLLATNGLLHKQMLKYLALS